jgi:probable F420-dependent oxidoreductase
MRLGFALPQVGKAAGPEAVTAVSIRAEELGFDSLWVLDRLLWPIKPRAPYPVGDGSLPVQYKTSLDPLQTLAFAAAQTKRVTVGSSVLNLPWYNPTLLARTLASLDVLSGGRLRVGLGMGWSPDEYEAAGTSWSGKGKRADELIRAIKTIWTTDPVEFKGEYVHIAESIIGLKPVQKPHPPIYMAAYTPGALQRVARESNGWFPVGIPLKAVPEMFGGIQAMAKEAGRDPSKLELIVRGNCELSDTPISGERAEFTGTIEQVGADIATAREIGAHELVLDVQFTTGVETKDDYLTRMKQLWDVANG